MLLQRALVALAVLSVATMVAVTLGDGFARREFGKRQLIHLGDHVLSPQDPAKPANFLLIGHDATGNSDTMMVVHLDPNVPTPLLVSFPRDLVVDIPGHGSGQLNAAFEDGGPALLIDTLRSYFHVRIQHYLQVDFDTFPQIVNAIGHVDIWFPTPVHDPYIGLDVEHAGCVPLDGTTALHYVRSRHYYVPDDVAHPAPWAWNYAAQRGGDGWTAVGSDIDRIPRQQYFLRTLAQAAISKSNDDPLKIIGVVDAVMSHLKTDQFLTIGELKAFVRTFRRVKPSQVEMTTIPWKTDPANVNRVVLDDPAATAVLDQLASFARPAQTLPKLVNPHSVTVRVVNGAGVAGLATQVQRALVAEGFRAAGPPGDADRSDYGQTEIRYAPGKGGAGATALYATGASVLRASASRTDTLGADVLIVVGGDWSALVHHLGGITGSSGSTGAHATTTTTSAVTTTSVDRRYIPVDPNTGGVLVGCPKS